VRLAMLLQAPIGGRARAERVKKKFGCCLL
jgi:hypothetical protein